MADTPFIQLLKIDRTGFGVKGAAELDAVQELMRRTGQSMTREDHIAMGAAIREPIRLLARYKAWAIEFYADWPVAYGEDNKIPVDDPIGASFVSSPEGRVQYITPGVQQFTRPSFVETKVGLRIYWTTLRSAGWPILARRLEEAADDLARRVDVKAKAAMDAAVVTTAGHYLSVSGGVMTQASVNSVISSANSIGFPVTQAAINPGRLTDMSTWSPAGSQLFPYFTAPEEKRGEVFTKLWADGYGGLRWIISHNVPIAEVWFSGDPAAVGYHQHHGAAQSASDIDIDEAVDKHVIRQDDAFYLGNQYNIWKLIINS